MITRLSVEQDHPFPRVCVLVIGGVIGWYLLPQTAPREHATRGRTGSENAPRKSAWTGECNSSPMSRARTSRSTCTTTAAASPSAILTATASTTSTSSTS